MKRDAKPPNERGRDPLASEKVFRLLKKAGRSGQTRAELAQLLYGETSYLAMNRIVVLVGSLRRKGHRISRIKDRGYLAGRYVLKSQK